MPSSDTQFKPGQAKTGGRVKGTPNKNTAEIKIMIYNALHRAGGEDYLLQQSKENPVAFMSLLKAILPKDVNLGNQEDNKLEIRIRGYKGDGN